MTHIHEDELVLHYYGEMDDAVEAQLATHLATCAACAEQYRRLQRVLAAVDAGAPADAPENFERIVWARLEPNLVRDANRWNLAPLALAAAVLVLVAGSFFAGRLLPRGADTGPAAASAEKVRERILLVNLGDHLDRTQMVLVDVVSADEGSVDMSAERERAGQLVAANRLYRQTAARSGEPGIVELLEELERVLVEVAASPDRMDATDFDMMRRRIESKGLLFKVRVVSSEVRERQKTVVGS